MKLRDTLEHHPLSTAFLLGVGLSATTFAAAVLTRNVLAAPRHIRLERSISSLAVQLERMQAQTSADALKGARSMEAIQRNISALEQGLKARSQEEVKSLPPVAWKGEMFKAPKPSLAPRPQSFGLHAGLGKFGPMPIVDPQNPNYITFGNG